MACASPPCRRAVQAVLATLRSPPGPYATAISSAYALTLSGDRRLCITPSAPVLPEATGAAGFACAFGPTASGQTTPKPQPVVAGAVKISTLAPATGWPLRRSVAHTSTWVGDRFS